MSREFKESSAGTCIIPHRFLTKKLQLSHHKLVKILKFCDENKRIFFSENGSNITLNCPKFKDICDEWTTRKLRSSSVVTPKKHHIDKEEDKEEDKERDKNKDIYSPGAFPFKEIIEHLNKLTGKNFRHNSADTQRLIKARLNQGFTLEDFHYVHKVKVAQWLNDPKYSAYLRPQTLYGTKFESYRNEKPHPLEGKVSPVTIKNIEMLENLEL